MQFLEEYLLFRLQEENHKDLSDGLKKRIKTLREMLSESGTDGYEYLQSHSFTELTREVADRFVKKIVIDDEQNIEAEWNFSEKLPEEARKYQPALL